MIDSSRKLLLDCLKVLLRPAVGFAFRHSLHIQDIVECAKVEFIALAEREAEQEARKVNVSRLSAVTGLHRRDVIRLFRESREKIEPRSVISRVMGQWQHNRRYTTQSGKPRVLTVEGRESEFSKLVGSISNDLHPGTVLSELERIGAVRQTKLGVQLVAEVYIPKDDLKQGLSILAADVGDLSGAVLENVIDAPKLPNLHARTEYDNVDPSAVPAIKKWLLKEGSAFHRRAREFIAKFDRDFRDTADTGATKKRARVSVGTFSYTAQD